MILAKTDTRSVLYFDSVLLHFRDCPAWFWKIRSNPLQRVSP